MAGLNDLVTNKEIQATSLPSWYSTAQQNLVNQATGVNAPALGDTVAQSAVSAFGTGSPFTAGQNILQSIGSGAANPWLISTDASGAQTVSPNIATPMGGLFQAQKDYLGQILPDIQAEETAKAISGGGFGGRMNLSGLARETGKAYSDLAQKQMQAALQSQQYGVSAGAGLSDIGQELVQSAINAGTFQQNAPFAGATNLANILSKAKPEGTITKSVELGGLNQIMGLLAGTQGGLNTLMGGTPLRDSSGKIITDASGKPIVGPGLLDQATKAWQKLTGTGTGTGSQTTAPDTSGWQLGGDPDSGYFWFDPSTGMMQDATGTVYQNGQILYSPSFEESYYNGGGSGLDTGGGSTGEENWLLPNSPDYNPDVDSYGGYYGDYDQ